MASTSSSGNEGGVQWEWRGDSLHWKPYSPSTSALIEAAFHAGEPSVHFSLAHSNYSVHFQPIQALQRNVATGRTRSIKRQTSGEGTCVQWLWWGNGLHTWHAYDDKLASRIEAAWKESTGGTKACAGLLLKIHGHAYNIEFDGDGVQYNLKTQFARGVRRKSSAGLECEVGVVSGAINSGSLQGNGCGNGLLLSNPPTRSLPNLSSTTLLGNDALHNNVQSRSSFLTSNDYESLHRPSHNSVDVVDVADPPDTEDCSICLGSLQEKGAATLSKCKHLFHRDCIELWFKTRPSCPECLTFYGTILGTQPPGQMHVQYIASRNASLAGYPGIDVIKITYKFSSGIQTEGHPNPGKPYKGTVRTAFLPENQDGEEVLKLLKKAWCRRLLFRIGTSVTTGQNNVVTWASIHHKTCMSGGSSHHGYPDDTYFSRVKKELEAVGVV